MTRRAVSSGAAAGMGRNGYAVWSPKTGIRCRIHRPGPGPGPGRTPAPAAARPSPPPRPPPRPGPRPRRARRAPLALPPAAARPCPWPRLCGRLPLLQGNSRKEPNPRAREAVTRGAPYEPPKWGRLSTGRPSARPGVIPRTVLTGRTSIPYRALSEAGGGTGAAQWLCDEREAFAGRTPGGGEVDDTRQSALDRARRGARASGGDRGRHREWPRRFAAYWSAGH